MNARKFFISTENFEVLNLGFDETHNNKEKGRHSCSLGEMLEFYSRDNDSIVERECKKNIYFLNGEFSGSRDWFASLGVMISKLPNLTQLTFDELDIHLSLIHI